MKNVADKMGRTLGKPQPREAYSQLWRTELSPPQNLDSDKVQPSGVTDRHLQHVRGKNDAQTCCWVGKGGGDKPDLEGVLRFCGARVKSGLRVMGGGWRSIVVKRDETKPLKKVDW